MKKLLIALFVLGGASLNAYPPKWEIRAAQKNARVMKAKKKRIVKPVMHRTHHNAHTAKRNAAIINTKKLITASMQGNLSEVKKLLNTSLLVAGLKDSSGNTALIYACMNATTGRNVYAYNQIARLLVNQGGVVNVVDSNKMTPLLWAIMNNNPGIVALLLKSGANVNVKNYQGYTPLTMAVEGSSVDSLALLLQSGKIKLDNNIKVLVSKAIAKYKKLVKTKPPAQFKAAHDKLIEKVRGIIRILQDFIAYGGHLPDYSMDAVERLEKAKKMIANDLKHHHSLSGIQRKNVMQVLGKRYQCPRGSYKATCGLCSCTETEMTCYCLTDQGKLRKSTIRTNLKEHEIIGMNKNGILEKQTSVHREVSSKPKVKRKPKGRGRHFFPKQPKAKKKPHLKPKKKTQSEHTPKKRDLFTNKSKSQTVPSHPSAGWAWNKYSATE